MDSLGYRGRGFFTKPDPLERSSVMFTKYAEVDEHAVHYVHTGPSTLPDVPPRLEAGELLLFVHGAGGSAGMWTEQLEHFERCGHSALALDLPAHGRSAGLEGLSSVEAYAALLGRFIRRLSLRPLVAVGRSMGGAVVLRLALAEPTLVRGLVLVGTAAGFDVADAEIEAWRDVTRGRRPRSFGTDAFSPKTGVETMKRVWAEEARTDPRVTYSDLLACRAFTVGDELADLAAPTLVVAGADDRVVPSASSEALARRIPNAETVVVPDAGHAAPLERPDAFNRSVLAFLERLS